MSLLDWIKVPYTRDFEKNLYLDLVLGLKTPRIIQKIPTDVLRYIQRIMEIQKLPTIKLEKSGSAGSYYGNVRTIVIDQSRMLGIVETYKGYRNTFWNVLVHELQHHKQYESGNLCWSPATKKVVWQGREMEITPWQAARDSDKRFKAYLNEPWEKEANEVSVLVVDYLIAEGILLTNEEIEASLN